MKILVIGGTAFTGPFIVRGLTGLGHAVVRFHRHTRAAKAMANVSDVRGDVAQLRLHADMLRRERFDIVVHMRAMTRGDARDAVEVFAGHAGRMVAASSQDVYAAFGALLKKEERAPSSLPLSEEAPLRSSRYVQGGAYEKLDVEEEFLAAGERLPVTILRMPATYGPADAQHRFYSYLKRMEDKRPAVLLDPALGNFKWSHGYVENVAHAFVLAATNEAAAGRIYNIGEGPQAKTPTIAERLHELARAAGYRGKILIVPREYCLPSLLQDCDFRHDLIINDMAIRKELGYAEVVETAEGFRRTIAWERAHPPADVDARAFDYDAEDRVLAKFGLLPKKR